MESKYYDGTKLLSMSDKNGEKPAIYLCTGNRTAGKSVFFKRLLLNNFINKGHKFIILYRFSYELQGCAEMFFNDIQPLFFKSGEMMSESVSKGLFYELFYNGKSCGYALALSGADALKKYSSYFTEVENIFLDEFQSETNHYAPNEMKKFQSIIVSVSRGNGKQFRYVRIMMASNTVTLLNPYYVQFGIHKMLRSDTKFLRGDGWVLENTFNETASQAIQESAFARAFSSGDYIGYASQNVYLNDNMAFIERMTGDFYYFCTIKFDDKLYGVKEYKVDGGTIMYVDDKPQEAGRTLTFKGNDHEANAIMLDKNMLFMPSLRRMFDYGKMRFKDLQCKNMIFDIMSIKS